MALIRSVLDIPAGIRNMDQAIYGDDAGYPVSSHIGQYLGKNDRALHANLRRAFGYSFPLDDLPVINSITGIRFGSWETWGTAGVTEMRLYLEAAIPNGEIVRIQTYKEGRIPWTVDGWGSDTELVGTGLRKIYGPFTVNITPGPQRIGFIITGEYDGVKVPAWLPVLEDGDGWIRAATGAFDPLASDAALQLRNWAGQTSIPLQITGVQSSGINAATDDIANIWPLSHNPNAFRNRWKEYQLMDVTQTLIYNIYWEESVLDSSLSDYNGRGGGVTAFIPTTENATHSLSHLVSFPLVAGIGNQKHFTSSRGHMIISDPFMNVELGDTLNIDVAEFVFDSTSEEEVLYIKPVFWAAVSVFFPRLEIRWRIITQDTAGVNQKIDAEWHSLIWSPSKNISEMSLLPFAWPFDVYNGLNEVRETGWLRHDVNLALPVTNRVLRFQAYAIYQTSYFDVPKTYLRSVYVFGTGAGA